VSLTSSKTFPANGVGEKATPE